MQGSVLKSPHICIRFPAVRPTLFAFNTLLIVHPAQLRILHVRLPSASIWGSTAAVGVVAGTSLPRPPQFRSEQTLI